MARTCRELAGLQVDVYSIIRSTRSLLSILPQRLSVTVQPSSKRMKTIERGDCSTIPAVNQKNRTIFPDDVHDVFRQATWGWTPVILLDLIIHVLVAACFSKAALPFQERLADPLATL